MPLRVNQQITTVCCNAFVTPWPWVGIILERFSRAGPRGRWREWATLGVHPMSWLLSNNRLEEVCGTLTTGTFSSRLLLSNQDKGCTPSVAHSLPLPLGPALLNLWNVFVMEKTHAVYARVCLVPCSFNMANFPKYNWYVLKKVYIVSSTVLRLASYFFFTA